VTSMMLLVVLRIVNVHHQHNEGGDHPSPFPFTPWGIVSGLFMVPGGTAGYWAVQTSGIAISQSIWSSLKVLVAFIWGALVFHEPLRSVGATVVAVLFLIVGLVGMGYYAAPSSSSFEEEMENELLDEPLLRIEDGGGENELRNSLGSSTTKRRYMGLIGAVIDGAYGGSVLVPMHFAGPEAKGFGFVGSFATGCLFVVCFAWLTRFLVCSAREHSFAEGFQSLPSFQLSTVGPYATFSGFIWSIGNICSVVSVAMLGQGIGYSLVQSQLLVAGLWGTLWFREIRGTSSILRWFLFAAINVAGMLLLSQQHIAGVVGGNDVHEH